METRRGMRLSAGSTDAATEGKWDGEMEADIRQKLYTVHEGIYLHLRFGTLMSAGIARTFFISIRLARLRGS